MDYNFEKWGQNCPQAKSGKLQEEGACWATLESCAPSELAGIELNSMLEREGQ